MTNVSFVYFLTPQHHTKNTIIKQRIMVRVLKHSANRVHNDPSRSLISAPV